MRLEVKGGEVVEGVKDRKNEKIWRNDQKPINLFVEAKMT